MHLLKTLENYSPVELDCKVKTEAEQDQLAGCKSLVKMKRAGVVEGTQPAPPMTAGSVHAWELTHWGQEHLLDAIFEELVRVQGQTGLDRPK